MKHISNIPYECKEYEIRYYKSIIDKIIQHFIKLNNKEKIKHYTHLKTLIK